MPASPVQISYVYSDSMEPTLETDEGYVLVPAGEVETGDVVTFWSPQRDEHVTHRVVGRTDEGFLTRGDNNDVTDQAAGYSPVTRDEVTGEVLTVGGDPVVLPGFGRVAAFVAAHRLLALAAAAALLLLGLAGDGDQSVERSVLRTADLAHPVLLVALVGSTLVVTAGGVHQSVTYVAVEDDASGPRSLAVGQAGNETVVADVGAVPLTNRVVVADGMSVTNVTTNESTVVLQAQVPPPSSAGPHRTDVSVYRLPAVLPAGLQRSLAAVTPALAGAVSVGVAFLPLLVAYLLFVDGPALLRSRGSHSRRRGWL